MYIYIQTHTHRHMFYSRFLDSSLAPMCTEEVLPLSLALHFFSASAQANLLKALRKSSLALLLAVISDGRPPHLIPPQLRRAQARCLGSTFRLTRQSQQFFMSLSCILLFFKPNISEEIMQYCSQPSGGMWGCGWLVPSPGEQRSLYGTICCM